MRLFWDDMANIMQRKMKDGVKGITLFFDSGKRAELYKSCRTIAYNSTYSFETTCCLGKGIGNNTFQMRRSISLLRKSMPLRHRRECGISIGHN